MATETVLNGNKVPSLVDYLKEQGIPFRKSEDDLTVFEIKVGNCWEPLKKDSQFKHILQVKAELMPVICGFMRNNGQRRSIFTNKESAPGCTFDTTALEGNSFCKCPECGLSVIPGVVHPTTRRTLSGKIVYA